MSTMLNIGGCGLAGVYKAEQDKEVTWKDKQNKYLIHQQQCIYNISCLKVVVCLMVESVEGSYHY